MFRKHRCHRCWCRVRLRGQKWRNGSGLLLVFLTGSSPAISTGALFLSFLGETTSTELSSSYSCTVESSVGDLCRRSVTKTTRPKWSLQEKAERGLRWQLQMKNRPEKLEGRPEPFLHYSISRYRAS